MCTVQITAKAISKAGDIGHRETNVILVNIYTQRTVRVCVCVCLQNEMPMSLRNMYILQNNSSMSSHHLHSQCAC